jgi:hypothetical protein
LQTVTNPIRWSGNQLSHSIQKNKAMPPPWLFCGGTFGLNAKLGTLKWRNQTMNYSFFRIKTRASDKARMHNAVAKWGKTACVLGGNTHEPSMSRSPATKRR